MSEMLTIGLHAEGSTDYFFLKPIIRRTIEEIILDCDRDVRGIERPTSLYIA